MWTHITWLYNEAGYSNLPHILFRNLRSTNEFHVVTKQKCAVMLSGFSPDLLNSFCDKGVDFLKDCTTWNIINNILENPRYNMFSDI